MPEVMDDVKEPRKTWWCKECEIYPDKIEEVFHGYSEERKWNGVEYEIQISNFGDDIDTRCGECGTLLEEKDETPEEVTEVV